MDKQERINQERTRLEDLFENVDSKEKKLIGGLISRAAYMKITLEDYEEDLDLKGYTEMFSQSEKTEPYERERPVARLYNTTVSNYQKIMKQLHGHLPVAETMAKGDSFEEFLRTR